MLFKKNRNDLSQKHPNYAGVINVIIYSVTVCHEYYVSHGIKRGILYYVILKNNNSEAIMAFMIWMRNFKDWKLSEHCRCRQIYLRVTEALVMLHMKRRADVATFQALVQSLRKTY